MTAAAAQDKKKYGLREIVTSLGQPKVANMFALGFASGLPFLLSGSTFGYWLRDEGTALTAIGFISWVQLVYAFPFKPLWAPVVDRLNLPFLGSLGQRRSWVLLAQIVIAAGLIAMAINGPSGVGGLTTIGALALLVAFASTTQDIAVDAWRIEGARNADELGLFTSSFQLGYRIALLVTDAMILISAQHLGWPTSYVLIAALLCLVGFTAVLKGIEPQDAEAVIKAKEKAAPLWTPRGFSDAVAGPFIAFFRTHGVIAVVMLLMISLYRLPDFMMGPMAAPLYHDLGLSKDTVGFVRASIGLPSALGGIAVGGLFVLKFGYMRGLIAGAIVQALAVASYAFLALAGPNMIVFGAVMAADSFGISFAGVALVTYMSSLTSLGYTATQYALMSSTYAFFGKFLKGFSGAVVDSLSHTRTLMEAYAIFFVASGAIGIPALLLCLVLAARRPSGDQAPAAA
ncbi:MAG TPA: MFS transporter [Caulobacterales bacterium]|nr:MFS transporter [Caulobacterales bacterium]